MSQVSDQVMFGYLTTAIEGGSAYWANEPDDVKEVSVKRDPETHYVTETTFTTDIDGEGWKTTTVGAKELRQALIAGTKDEKLPPHLRRLFMDMLYNRDLDYDAGDADCALQYALFGDIVFG